MSNDPGQPLVSIITVNYNGHKETLELLASLEQLTYPNVEVIVVDNGSPIAPPAELINHPNILFIQSVVNLGFSGGNNLGIKAAKGDYYFLLNNDTEIQPGFLEPIIAKAVSEPQIGLISPKIIFHNRGNIMQYAGCTPIHPITSRGFAIGFGQQDGPGFQQSGYTARAHGAAMLISKQLAEVVGLLPENYFLYYEEMDYCETVKRAGFKIWFEAQSIIYHKESMSVGKHSPVKAYFMHRNRWLYVRRNVNGFKKFLAGVFLLTIVYPKEILVYLKNGQYRNAWQVIKGIAWNLCHKSL